jgi:hypothetical protein
MGGGGAAKVRFEDFNVCSNLKTIVARPLDLTSLTAQRPGRLNARDGSTPDPNTKTALQLEAVEPHIIAIIAIFVSGKMYIT